MARSKRRFLNAVLALAVSAAPGAAALASGDEVRVARADVASEGAPEREQAKEAPDTSVVYVPPRRGAPRTTVSAGTRGIRALPRPRALVPDHTALTTQRSPSLFWHLDGAPPAGARVVFTLIDTQDPEAIDPLAEVELPRPGSAGIQRVRLSELGISLERDVEYQWSVALVPDESRRGRDQVAFGYVKRVEVPELRGKPASAAGYARHSLWYDALESLSDAIDASPDDASLRARRDALLRQAELGAAVE